MFNIKLTILSGLVFLAGFLPVTQTQLKTELRQLSLQNQLIYTESRLGVDNVLPVTSQRFRLYGSGVASTDTTIRLVTFRYPVSNQNILMADLGTTAYGVIDPNTSRKETVSFESVTQNADGTATLGGVTRGLSGIAPYAASTTLAQAHSGGSIFVLSNPAPLYGEFAGRRNDERIYGDWIFSSTTIPRLDVNVGTSTWNTLATSTFATVGYVNDTNNVGASNANDTSLGLVQMATRIQAASSTLTGSTGGRLVLGANLATASPTDISTSTIPVTNSVTGQLSSLFIATSSLYRWGGSQQFDVPLNASSSLLVNTRLSVSSSSPSSLFTTVLAGTTTFAGKTIFASTTFQAQNLMFTWPNSYTAVPSGAVASSTMFSTGNGVLFLGPAFDFGASTTNAGFVAGTAVYTHNLGRVPTFLRVTVTSLIDNGGTAELAYSEGIATTTAAYARQIGHTTRVAATAAIVTYNNNQLIRLEETGGTVAVQADVEAWDSTTFTLNWTTNEAIGAGSTRKLIWEIR